MRSLLTFMAFSLSLVPALAQSDCELRRDDHHLKVYVCPTKHSKLKAVKVSLDVEGTVSQAAAMILDIDGYKAWQFGTAQAKILKRVSDHELYYYHEVHAPLVSNRDFAVRLTMQQNPTTRELVVEAMSVPDFIPAYKKIVRVPFSKGVWSIKPVGHHIHVEYMVEVDLGGELPAWIVNPLAPKASFETFDGFRKKIVSYRGKKVDFIKD